MNVANLAEWLYGIQWNVIVIFWGGLVGYFFTVKSVDNPKNRWYIPSVYFLVFIVPSALVNLQLGLATLLVGSMVVLKWSVTGLDKPYMQSTPK